MECSGPPRGGGDRSSKFQDGLLANGSLVHNEQQEARETLLASADYRHPVDHALVRNARLARLSGDS